MAVANSNNYTTTLAHTPVSFGYVGVSESRPAKYVRVTNASALAAPVFKPTATGARRATLGIADNGTGSPQTAAPTGSGSPLPTMASLRRKRSRSPGQANRLGPEHDRSGGSEYCV